MKCTIVTKVKHIKQKIVYKYLLGLKEITEFANKPS